MIKNKNVEGSLVLYAWSLKNDPTFAVVGQTLAKPNESLEKAVRDRVRQCQGKIDKKAFDMGDVIINGYWNIEKLARAENKNYSQSHFDDYFRPYIGMRNGGKSEMHLLPPDEVTTIINETLAKLALPPEPLKLAPWQSTFVSQIHDLFAKGQVVMAELCPRAGKTNGSLALLYGLKYKINIIASYVLSSHASFRKEISSYAQFANMRIIDSKDTDYKEQVLDAIVNNKQAVITVSMVKGELRQDRLDFFKGLTEDKLWVIDEADYGAHTQNQSIPFANAVNANDKVLLMTGTNGDRACGNWKIDQMTTMPYVFLQYLKKQYMANLKNYKYTGPLVEDFEVNPKLVEYVVDTKYYQMNLSPALESYKKRNPNFSKQDVVKIASWDKVAKRPSLANGFVNHVLDAIFYGKNNLDNLNIAFQSERIIPKQETSMWFFPANTTNKSMKDLEQIFANHLPDYLVLSLHGSNTFMGKDITNENAESIATDARKLATQQNKGLILLSAKMAIRSFSRPDITNIFLCYDNGDAGNTQQKISRGLTLDREKIQKTAYVWSLSFDPNRDDKFDIMFITAAQQVAKTEGIKIDDAVRKVFSTLDIFSCNDDGAIAFDIDEYMQQLLDRPSVSRVVGRQANLSLLDAEDFYALYGGTISSGLEKTEITEKGKTFKDIKSKKAGDKVKTEQQSIEEHVRKVLATIVEELPTLTYMTNQTTLHDSLVYASNDSGIREYVTQEFHVSPQKILEFFERGVLNYELASMQSIAKVQDLESI
jgi:hypothetical protein